MHLLFRRVQCPQHQVACVRRSTKPLIATCVRHAKDLLGVDLSACKEWLPMVEVHYQRPPSSSSPDAMESTEVRFVHGCNWESPSSSTGDKGDCANIFVCWDLFEALYQYHRAAAVKLASVFLVVAGLRDLPGKCAVSHTREVAGPVEGAGGLAEEEGSSRRGNGQKRGRGRPSLDALCSVLASFLWLRHTAIITVQEENARKAKAQEDKLKDVEATKVCSCIVI